MRTTALFDAGFLLLTSSLFLPAPAFSGEPMEDQAAPNHATSKLELEGKPVERLVLVDEQNQRHEFRHPSSPLSLPPGRYQIAEISVRWNENEPLTTDRDVIGLTLSPSATYRLILGGPPDLGLSVKRQGDLLMVDYKIPRYSSDFWRNSPPLVAIYRGEHKLASGTLEYH
jgi:hypothetical protein